MTEASQFLAIDWGTTNRRAYRLSADGTVHDVLRDGRGVAGVAREAFASEVAAIRAQLGDLPVLAAGMVGSARGWVDAGYCAAPAGLADLAQRLVAVEPGRSWIIPGVSDPAGDVMRGEEVQLLGAAAAGLVPADALLCQPGTHCKWGWLEGGRIAHFRTALTGELFALLREHSLLSEFLAGTVSDGPAFRDGLAAAAQDDLLGQLFRVRAAAVLGQRAVADCAAFASGLLIGSDVRGSRLVPGSTVWLLAEAPLGPLYAAAIAAAGARAELISSEAAFLAGMTRLWSMLA